MSRFFYSVPASRHEALAVFDDLAAIERPPPGTTRNDFADLVAGADFTAAVYLGSKAGPLAGVAAVFESAADGLDELAFTKTAALVRDNPVSFARSIPNLLADVHKAWGRPLAIHRPASERDARWFVRCGCADFGKWLVFPSAN